MIPSDAEQWLEKGDRGWLFPIRNDNIFPMSVTVHLSPLWPKEHYLLSPPNLGREYESTKLGITP
jgi:hypothetical protein